MMNILSLGNSASQVCESLKKYTNYKIFSIRNEGKNSKYNFVIPEYDSPEDYESWDPSGKIKFLDHITDEVTFFVCGASKSSALSLRILEILHNKGVDISVVYFQPEIEFLSDFQVKQERVTRGVLQQYARSGLFKDITMISLKDIESLVGEISVFDYFRKISEVFCDSYHMIQTFKNTKPIMSTFSQIKESCRIKTIGVSNLSCENKLFFPFKNEVEVVYYFGVNEEKLKKEGNLFRELIANIKNKISEDKKIYFGIYPTKYEDDYIYVEHYSPKIQENYS